MYFLSIFILIINKLIIRQLGQCNWQLISNAMHQFIDRRNCNTIDEIWLVEHYPIFTQGQNSNPEHLLRPGNIPVVKSDRGGQITYHGPGQQVMYILLDIKRHNMKVHDLVSILEKTVIFTLAEYDIYGLTRVDAPGVYVGKDKICSLGLRIRKGYSFHGLALNVDMDLAPFLRINPCGQVGMRMVQISQFKSKVTISDIQPYLVNHFANLTGFSQIKWL